MFSPINYYDCMIYTMIYNFQQYFCNLQKNIPPFRKTMEARIFLNKNERCRDVKSKKHADKFGIVIT